MHCDQPVFIQARNGVDPALASGAYTNTLGRVDACIIDYPYTPWYPQPTIQPIGPIYPQVIPMPCPAPRPPALPDGWKELLEGAAMKENAELRAKVTDLETRLRRIQEAMR